MPILFLIILIVMAVVLYGISVHLYNLTISTVYRNEPPDDPEKKTDNSHFSRSSDQKTKERSYAGPDGNDKTHCQNQRYYFDTHKTEDIYMQSRDSLMLHGTAVINDRSRWVIICHGYSSTARQMSSYAELFDELGFSVLAVDLRGHGESEGTYRGMGWHDSYDVWDWSCLLEKRYKARDIILFGISMGGATVMMAAGHALPESVKGVIEDCGYSSVKAELKYSMKKRYHLPSFPLLNMASFVTKRRAGYSLLTDGDAAAQLRLTKLPVLFIHGEDDTFVPFAMMSKVYKAASGPKMKFTVAGAGHGKSYSADPDGYRDAVYSFLYKYIRI